MRRANILRKYKWDNDIAYLVGLITADGCLYGDNRHINLTSKDKELLIALNRILGKSYTISSKMGGYNTEAYQINFSNVAFYDFLKCIGLCPAKSKVLQSLDVPDQYYGDFLRGLFDGDGTIYGYKDARWRSSFQYYTSFASASITFLHWIQATNARLADTGTGRISAGTRVVNLTYAKSNSRKLFGLMYQHTDEPRLTRKHERWIAFFNRDRYSYL